jgi:signal transduction histidine kinase
MANTLNFKVSSALKDILGRDLISDDFIAVFELVKNSFDAHATRVDLRFDNLYSGQGKITIIDNGKGMSYDDLLNKWLFVAYSAKKDGTEDTNYDYRRNISSTRQYAGAKGIGRFSCDKLGKRLYLETSKDEVNSKTETLLTEWENFEKNTSKQFVEIGIIHETIAESTYGLKHGTVLVIEDLRSEWSRPKLLKLKHSLEKLINPKKTKNGLDFKINIDVPEELEEDNSFEESYSRVNGEVQNFIFDALGLKTTKISSSISADGKFISTELRDGGTLIYNITEVNNFPLLNDIQASLYYLNMSAKNIFARRMGVSSSQYGNLFLYKNGFRVYPYGEPGEDPLKIDSRKAQGFRRFLGNRDIIGQVDIYSLTDQLKETSTRGDGLIKTPTYFQLEDFIISVLKRLEKYVVDVQKWGLSFEDNNSYDLKMRVSELLVKLTGSSDLIEFEIPENFLNIIDASQINSAEAIIKNLGRIAIESENSTLQEHVQKASVRLVELQAAKEEAEAQAELEYRKAQEATSKLRETISENLFLKSINTSEYQEVIALLHHIGIYAGTIDNNLRGISLRIQNNIALSTDELYDIIRAISFEAKKILNVVAFATKANFKLTTEELEIDLVDYIREYIQNIIPTITDKALNIKVVSKTSSPFIRTVKAIEINIVIDNLINNSRKAKADNLLVIISETSSGTLEVKFVDNGLGIDNENLSRIYDFGFTTTDGSGLGLFHVKEIMASINGKISAQNNYPDKGVTFTLEFK